MAARIDRIHTERVRQRIKVTQLMKSLEDNVLGRKRRKDATNQKESDFLSPEQVSCAKILLAKAVPDLQRTEHTGKDGAPFTVSLVAGEENV